MKSETCFEQMLEQYLPSKIVENNLLNGIKNTSMSLYELHKYGLPNKYRVIPRKKCDRCSGEDGKVKQGYLTKDEAHSTAQMIHVKEGKILRVYKCKYGGWHLTKAL